jgi:hypothetical protein
MNKRRLLLQSMMIALILAVVAIPVKAAENVQVTLTTSQGEVTVGDPIELTLEVNHPAGYQVIIPKLEGNWGPFEVRGQSQATTMANDDGTETTYQTITVTLFDLGNFETPALPLTINDGTGGVMEELTPPVSLTVVSTLAEGDTALKDIRPQVGMKVPSALPWVMGGLLLATVVVGGGWWLYRRWRGHGSLAHIIDNRPPYQVAADELDRIDGLRLPEKGRFKEHYTLVTDCLRTYIEKQFHVSAFDRTTSELKASLRQSTMTPDHARRFIDLFMDSDLVKFAKLTPDVEDAHALTNQARDLVDLTKPAPETEEPEISQDTFGMGGSQRPVEVVR